jgi:hypothetical protein
VNAGKQTLDWLYREQLRVDDEWSIRTPSGFKWWAYQHAQTIEIVGRETGPDGQVGELISVRTEFIKSIDLDDRKLASINKILMPTASMAGVVYDAHAKTLSFASLVRVHEGIAGWMKPILSVAAVLQIGEARLFQQMVTEAWGAEDALSGPPGRELRDVPDEMAELCDGLIVPLGQEPARWGAAEFDEAVEDYMRSAPALAANAGGAGFTVEFPYGEQSSLCRAMADQRHPRYGNGLLMVQSFPVQLESELKGAELALQMNAEELTKSPTGYGFGSYCYRGGMLHFNSFYPNALYRPGLLPNFYFAAAQRARAMAQRFTGKDWDNASFSASRSALGRMIDRLRGR